MTIFHCPHRRREWLALMDKVSYDLLDFEELKRQRNTELLRPGIYFIWSGDEIVYIGQSIDMHSRVSNHITGGTNRFLRDLEITACTFLDCKREELDILEALYISKYKPKCNGRRKDERPV